MNLNIAIVGQGNFGNKIKEKIANNNIINFDPRIDSYSKINNGIDLVIIASPASTHYEIVKRVIDLGIDVFCEKPFTITLKETEELLELAKNKKVDIYVDDVFLYRNEFNSLSKNSLKGVDCISFKWIKYGSFSDDLYSDLLYHDLYILIELFGEQKIKLEDIIIVSKDILKFNFLFGKNLVIINYDRTQIGVYEKNICISYTGGNVKMVDFSNRSNDALQEMLNAVLLKSVKYSFNNKRSQLTMKYLEMIRIKLDGG